MSTSLERQGILKNLAKVRAEAETLSLGLNRSRMITDPLASVPRSVTPTLVPDYARSVAVFPEGLGYPYVSYEVSRDLEVQHLRARCESLERELQNAKKEAYEAKVMEEDSKRREMDALRIIRPTQEQPNRVVQSAVLQGLADDLAMENERLRGAVNDHVTVELQHEGIEMRLTQDIQNLEQQIMELRRINGDLQFKNDALEQKVREKDNLLVSTVSELERKCDLHARALQESQDREKHAQEVLGREEGCFMILRFQQEVRVLQERLRRYEWSVAQNASWPYAATTVVTTSPRPSQVDSVASRLAQAEISVAARNAELAVLRSRSISPPPRASLSPRVRVSPPAGSLSTVVI
ncbi:hypothetical protein GUITHDRAFT_135006 [Guillardia theta CCMP2712]|uniref:Uncharacterized protein n=1 Tax=Guillardia theta (strain CCMP2712) TaxID=905079 RepID=L1JRK5_GUITC|nr:hypothetical protein GUITHDRAFT_135006 [Guillardia theta CCMP2712]EKX50924.1 hypothetical protein GUITHDRAFT_135006 [Guillardia theta CCMP2712]|eukprot:XP_005837904.1 hypothetical protein GUITHDRAFT_135006 [Guillardia theta CCMP2712]